MTLIILLVREGLPERGRERGGGERGRERGRKSEGTDREIDGGERV